MAMIKKKAAAPAKPEFALAQRLGKFTFEDALVTDPEMTPIGIKVMAGVLVIQCVHNPLTGNFEYLGMSEHFEGVAEGEEIPSYDVGYDEEAEAATWTKSE